MMMMIICNDDDDDLNTFGLKLHIDNYSDDFVFFLDLIEITNTADSVEVSLCNAVVGSSLLKRPDLCPASRLSIELKHLETKASSKKIFHTITSSRML